VFKISRFVTKER